MPILERRAVIDVGTNSVKLLVAEVAEGVVRPLIEKSRQTRLGQGFYETHFLQTEAISTTAQTVADFRAEALAARVAQVRVIATSAARDALNRQALVLAIRETAGLNAEIITGDQEAEWAFRGVVSDSDLAPRAIMILDVGGGSTQIILGDRGHYTYRQSFNLGAVRLYENLRPAEPPTLADVANCRRRLQQFFNTHILPAFETALQQHFGPETVMVATGGTANVLAMIKHQLARFERERVEGTRLTRQYLLDHMVQLWSLPLAERRQIVGLPPDRADIILTGVAIYEAVMEHFRFPELVVSTRGLRFGAILDAGQPEHPHRP